MTKIKQNFEGHVISTGIDVHKKSYHLTVYLDTDFYKTVTMPASPAHVTSYLEKNFPGATYRSVYEAGFCGFGLHHELTSANIANIVIHPADVHMSHKHKEQKSDKSDSKLLAQNLLSGFLTGIYIPSEEQIGLRNIMRFRDQVVKDLNRSRCRIKSKLLFLGVRIPEQYDNSTWSRKFVSWLENVEGLSECDRWALDAQINIMLGFRKHLLEVNRKLRALSRSEEFAKAYQQLVSVPGIGPVGAWRFLTEIGDMKRFSSENKLCSYVGLIPNSKSSGERENKGRITTRGNKRLRTTLIEAAWTAVRNDPSLAKYYQKKKQSKTHKNTAIVAVARKLLCKIRSIMLNGQLYQKGLK